MPSALIPKAQFVLQEILNKELTLQLSKQVILCLKTSQNVADENIKNFGL